jgi:hypothetical protein
MRRKLSGWLDSLMQEFEPRAGTESSLSSKNSIHSEEACPSPGKPLHLPLMLMRFMAVAGLDARI